MPKNISINRLSFSYTKKSQILIDELMISNNKITTIIGPNGSGKSTLLKLISGYLKPSSGYIRIDDKNINSYKNRDLAKKITRLPQSNEIFEENIYVKDLVAKGRYPYQKLFTKMSKDDYKIIEDVMRITEVTSLQDKYFSTLSGGQKQKVLLSLILAQNTDYILLDEPISALDIDSQYNVLEIIKNLKKENKSILLVLHDINLALKYSDQIVIMDKGKIISNSVNIEESIDNIKNVFKIDIQAVDINGSNSYVTKPIAN